MTSPGENRLLFTSERDAARAGALPAVSSGGHPYASPGGGGEGRGRQVRGSGVGGGAQVRGPGARRSAGPRGQGVPAPREPQTPVPPAGRRTPRGQTPPPPGSARPGAAARPLPGPICPPRIRRSSRRPEVAPWSLRAEREGVPGAPTPPARYGNQRRTPASPGVGGGDFTLCASGKIAIAVYLARRSFVKINDCETVLRSKTF